MTVASVVILVGLMVFLAHVLEDVFAKTKVPDVLLLLALGLVLGPVSNLVRPEHFGSVGPVFTTLTLLIILFEGGLGLDIRTLGHSLRGATGLTLLHFLATLAVTAPVARMCFGFSWITAFTLGAILGGTSSAVVIPTVQRLTLDESIKVVLALESAFSDVLVIVVALGLIHAQTAGSLDFGNLLGGIIASFCLATALGVIAGIIWSMALNRIHGLQRSIFTTPAYVLVVYGLVELLGYSGAIAALALGVTLGNIDALPLKMLRRTPETLASLNATERQVFSEIVFLLKTFFFVFIGLSLRFTSLWLLLGGMALTLALFAVRIPVVHIGLSPRTVSRFSAATSGAMAPRGLAAAVVASIPAQMGLPGGETIQLVTYAVVLFSILTASVQVFLLERNWLKRINARLYWRYPEVQERQRHSVDSTEM